MIINEDKKQERNEFGGAQQHKKWNENQMRQKNGTKKLMKTEN